MKNNIMLKSYLGQPGDPGGSHAMLRENFPMERKAYFADRDSLKLDIQKMIDSLIERRQDQTSMVKSYVKATTRHLKSGKVVAVKAHTDSRQKHDVQTGSVQIKKLESNNANIKQKNENFISEKEATKLADDGKGEIIYSGTGGDKAIEIKPYGEKLSGGGNNLFGGIFGSFDKDIAESHGSTIQKIFSPKHIDHDDFRHEVFYEEKNTDEVNKNLKEMIGKTNLDIDDVTEDELPEILDYVMGDSIIEDYRKEYDPDTGEYESVGEPEMGIDRFVDLIGYTGNTSEYIGEAGWLLQGLKGELARRMGYTSVGMPDEHGESVLALPGSKIIIEQKKLNKAFVKVPPHTRGGKKVAGYTYFDNRKKKIADVRHSKMTRVDYGKKEAESKIDDLKSKVQHHDNQISAAEELKQQVKEHRSKGNNTFKVGNKEHSVEKVISELDDHIKHHTNEKKSHENHIRKIENRHETERKHWEKQKEIKAEKETARKEAKGYDKAKQIIKDTLGSESVTKSDVMKVMSAAKQKGDDDYAHMNNYLMNTRPDLRDEVNRAGVKLDSMKTKAIDELIQTGEHEGEKLSDDILGVLKRMKGEESEKKVVVKKSEEKPQTKSSLNQLFEKYYRTTDKSEKVKYANLAKQKFMEENPKASLNDYLKAAREAKPKETEPIKSEAEKKETRSEAMKGNKNAEKEPWKMTLSETKNREVDIYSKQPKPLPKSKHGNLEAMSNYDTKKSEWVRSYRQAIKNTEGHKDIVIKALKEGKKVPGEVLKDYPDLQKQPERKAIIAKREKIQDFGEKIGGARKDTAQRGYTMSGGKEKDDIPTWKKQYQVAEIVSGKDKGKFSLINNRAKGWNSHIIRKLFDTRKEAEEALPLAVVGLKHSVWPAARETADSPQKYDIIRKVTDRKHPVIVGGFDSEEDAMKYMATHADEIIEKNIRIDDNIHPAIENPVRKGKDYRNGKDVVAKDFQDTFGFRGVEFGNWNNSAERQALLNHAYDSFMDLSKITGLSPKEISLNGELGLGFGSRGVGLTGAKAHFERSYVAMNLTKMKGAGSLAHEWWHALDHYIARKTGKASDQKVKNSSGDMVYKTSSVEMDYASHGIRKYHKASDELIQSFKDLNDKIHNRDVEFTDDISKKSRMQKNSQEQLVTVLDNFVSDLKKDYSDDKYPRFRGKKNNQPATPEQMKKVEEIAKRIKSGDFGKQIEHKSNSSWPIIIPETISQLSDLYKEIRGRNGITISQGKLGGALSYLRDRVSFQKRYNEDLKEAEQQKVKTKKVNSDFHSESWKLDQGRSGDYWVTNHEMAARAFESWIYDKTKNSGDRNDFLAYEKHNDRPEYKVLGVKPYPEGKERTAINKEFDKFFDVMKKDDKFVSSIPKIERKYSIAK